MARIYVSSTFSDLEEYRKKVSLSLRRLGHEDVAMEYYVAEDRRPLDRCLKDVASSDLYIGIFAWRYGHVPQNDNPEGRSITELEYKKAQHDRIPCLIFMLSEEALWPKSRQDKGIEAERIENLRNEILSSERSLVGFFETDDELTRKVNEAVIKWMKESGLAGMRLSTDPDSLPYEKSSVRTYIYLPTPRDRRLFERDADLDALDRAWNNSGTRIMSLIGRGGVGKSALVYQWLHRLEQDGWRGAERVFAWTFHSQGTKERAGSIEEFMKEATAWLGQEPVRVLSSEMKGRRLANLLSQQRTLLVLDGFEPLQYSPVQDDVTGAVKEPAMKTLMQELSFGFNGLCIITSRLRVQDLEGSRGFSAEVRELSKLTERAGAQLLKKLGVEGSVKQLQITSAEVDGDPLALVLLGHYLRMQKPSNPFDPLKQLPRLADIDEGKQARRIMLRYEGWWTENGRESLELIILQMIGFFNRPADKQSLAELRRDPPIPGLTDHLAETNERDWSHALARLREYDLLYPEDRNNPDLFDAHPFVREHFGERLRHNQPEAWREGHDRLYALRRRETREDANTLEEMIPLLSAVTHACCACRYKEAFNVDYWQKIHREYDHYIGNVLGGWAADLAVLSGFFNVPWTRPVDALEETEKAHIMNEAGFDLYSLGRLEEAKTPLEASLNLARGNQYWHIASVAAGNLSKVHLTLGEVQQAMGAAEEGVHLADQSGNIFWQVAIRTWWADALHKARDLERAESIFLEAERRSQVAYPHQPFLRSFEGYRYCSFLLSKIDSIIVRNCSRAVNDSIKISNNEQEQVENLLSNIEKRALVALKWAKKNDRLYEIALDHMTLGSIEIVKASCLQKNLHWAKAQEHLKHALDGLKECGSQRYLLEGLLIQSKLERLQNNLYGAQVYLEQIMETAIALRMRLHEVDARLEWIRLRLQSFQKHGKRDELQLSSEDLKKANILIQKTGYSLRADEVKRLDDHIQYFLGFRRAVHSFR